MKTLNATDSQSAATHTWLTPKYVIDALGEFDLDPCAAPMPRPWATAAQMNSESECDGLALDWSGKRVWCNPPYGSFAEAWLKKLEAHGDGIALVFARIDTRWLQEILSRNGFFAFAGRLKFIKPDGTPAPHTAGSPSILIPFGQRNVDAILNSGLRGFYKP